MRPKLARIMSLTPFLAEDEYDKKTGISPTEVQIVQDWLKSQPHLPDDHITVLDIILALHSCNNSLSVTKQVIDLHFTLKTHLDVLFKDRIVDEKLENALNVMSASPLPTRSKEGYACIYFTFINPDPKKFIHRDLCRMALMVMELWQYEEGTWPGMIFIIDFEHLQLAHLAAVDLSLLQQFFFYLQEAMLVRFKGMHFINAPSIMDKVMLMIRPILKKEILDAVKIHPKGATTLEEYYPVDALPKESGGSYKSSVQLKNITLEKLKENSEFFAQESLKRVDESKRPGKPKVVSDYFGSVDGSFKKLDVF